MENTTDREMKAARRIAEYLGASRKKKTGRTELYRRFGKLGAMGLDRALDYAKREYGVRETSKLSTGCKGEKVFYSRVKP